MKHSTPEDYFADARQTQLATSFANTLAAAANIYVARTFADLGKHKANSWVAKQIVKRFGPGEEARSCMATTLEAIDRNALTPAYKADDAHFDAWQVMEKHLEAGTEFDWLSDERKLAAFNRMMDEAAEAGQAGTA